MLMPQEHVPCMRHSEEHLDGLANKYQAGRKRMELAYSSTVISFVAGALIHFIT